MASSRKSAISSGKGNSRALRVGQIVGFHGLRGDVKVRPAAPNPDWVGTIKKVMLVLPNAEQTLTVAASKSYKQAVLMRFKGFPDRTSVEHLRGGELYASESDLPALDEDELYVDELAGMTLVDATGKTLGRVKEMLSSAGQDFLDLVIDGKPDTVLIPYNDHFFPNIDRNARTITVAGLDGFL